MFVKDEWNGLADLLANLIEKYAAELDIENLPDPEKKEDLSVPDIAIQKAA